jgi:Rrf2 family iron-sulfur cluster assembly transcriptional regulator
MYLTTRGRYAVMAMLDLAILSEEQPVGGRLKPVTLAQIAERQDISLSYLEQLFAKLRKAGVVDSLRGPGGGYTLGRAAGAIKLLDIVHAVEESVDVTRCGVMDDAQALHEGQGCVHGKKCVTHDLWTALGRHMEDFLRRMSLQYVLDGAVDPDGQLLRPGQPLRVLIEAQN